MFNLIQLTSRILLNYSVNVHLNIFASSTHMLTPKLCECFTLDCRSSREAPDRNMCIYLTRHPICPAGVALLWQNAEYVPVDKTVKRC